MHRGIWGSLMVLGLAVAGRTGAAEDDLSVVKRAVAEQEKPAPSPARTDQARPATAQRNDKHPQWLRVRIIDKKDKHAKVSINLPLGLVRAFSDDIALDDSWHDHAGKHITLGEVLRTLDSGQSLVEIDDLEASVRVWIE